MTTRIAIVGWGNVGRGIYEAILRNPDMELAGIATRRPEEVKKQTTAEVVGFYNCHDLKPDVAVLCGGSAKDLPSYATLFARNFNTVDSFDTHADIPNYFKAINENAEFNGNVSVICAGWDPGTFSLERVLGEAFLPGSKSYTFWGPGVSQGHSDACRKVTGVKDARQYTIPIETALNSVRKNENPELTTRQKHLRVVYVVAEDGYDKDRISNQIKTMPNYFEPYDTEVNFISQEEMDKNHSKMPHGGFVLTSGETGKNNSASIEYRNTWASNPEATGSILIACARACHRFKREGKRGAFTMLDIPPAYFSIHSREDLLKNFM